MKHRQNELRREDILELAHQAKLMIADGGVFYMNDMATDKELLTFARLLEAKCQHEEQQGSSLNPSAPIPCRFR